MVNPNVAGQASSFSSWQSKSGIIVVKRVVCACATLRWRWSAWIPCTWRIRRGCRLIHYWHHQHHPSQCCHFTITLAVATWVLKAHETKQKNKNSVREFRFMGLQEPCVAMAHLQILIGSYYGVGWKQFKSVLFVQSGNLHDQIVEFKTFFCSEAFPWCLGSASKTRKGV